MAESEHDDLADALAQLASGDVAPSEHEPAHPIDPPAKVVQPASSRSAASKPPAPQPAPTARPTRPPAPALSNTTPTPTPPSQSRVTIRPVAPVLRQQRPMAPTINIPDEPEVSGNESTALSGDNDGQPIIADDDDAMIMPAADAVVLPGAKKKLALARAKAASQKSLEFRRTMIPILLTCGTLMLAFASLKFVSGSESSLSVLPIWVPLLLVIAGAIVLALAVINVLTVKQQLAGKM